MALYGGIEAGGTKWICAVGAGATDVRAEARIETTTPRETIARAVAFLREHGPLAGVGIGSFGPVDPDPASPGYGTITSTPKPGWGQTRVAPAVAEALGAPVAFDTDVNAAALAEGRLGAARGLDTFCYVTVGTGIGGGAFANGRVLHGLVHPELGHMRIPHDRARDPFEGACPFHGDCLEGLASGVALERRFGRPAHELEDGHEAWPLEAEYLALGLANVVFALAPQRIVVGGGVAARAGLLELVRGRLDELVGGYVPFADVVPPALGARAGVVGALLLAERAAARA